MAGLYIHIPFCASKCAYCDFYSITEKNILNIFIDALTEEIRIKSETFPIDSVETIYFGGGTPSVLEISHIDRIINVLGENLDISTVKEISFEANPDDLNIAYLKDLKSVGINRLSIGVQSFSDDILKLLKRRHDAQKAIQSVLLAEKSGFDNICIDLIYGIAGIDNEKWIRELKTAFALPIKHLSAYHLSVEPGTDLFLMQKRNLYKSVDEELSRDQFFILNNISEEFGFNHYEISNLAKSGYKSIHNSAYWDEKPYLGFGPSAHSYWGDIRLWNTNNINEYIKNINRNGCYYDYEEIDSEKRFNEYLIKKLRTSEGVNYKDMKSLFGQKKFDQFIFNIKRLSGCCYVSDNEDFRLSLAGWFISDSVISSLMI